MDEEIRGIQEDLRKLQERIERYLDFQQIDNPIIDPLIPSTPIDPNPVVAKCSECGLEMAQVMGYVCSHPKCPTGIGGTYCGTGQPGHNARTTIEGKTIC